MSIWSPNGGAANLDPDEKEARRRAVQAEIDRRMRAAPQIQRDLKRVRDACPLPDTAPKATAASNPTPTKWTINAEYARPADLSPPEGAVYEATMRALSYPAGGSDARLRQIAMQRMHNRPQIGEFVAGHVKQASSLLGGISRAFSFAVAYGNEIHVCRSGASLRAGSPLGEGATIKYVNGTSEPASKLCASGACGTSAHRDDRNGDGTPPHGSETSQGQSDQTVCRSTGISGLDRPDDGNVLQPGGSEAAQ